MHRIVQSGIGLAALLHTTLAFGGEALRGPPTILDGDTLRLHGTVIGLYGVAAPGMKQRCEDGGGRSVACGALAAHALAERIGTAGVACETRGTDRHRRTLAICRIGDEDLGAWMVANGFAVADRLATRDYIPQSLQAWARRRGLWAGVFEDPTERVREDFSATVKLSAVER